MRSKQSTAWDAYVMKLAILFSFCTPCLGFSIQVFHLLIYVCCVACNNCGYCSEEPTEPFTYLDLDPPKRESEPVKLE